MKKYTISGIEHILGMLKSNPQLMSLSSLVPIVEVANKAAAAVKKSGCGCSAGPVYAANRAVFERALGVMAFGDHLIVKNVLNVDQICYYIRTDKGNTLKCI